MDQLKNKRILFLYPYGYWPANPNCVSFIERCEKDGIPFDLVCPSALNCRGDGKAISEWAWLVRRLFFSAIKQSFRRPWKTPIIWKTLLHFYDLKHRIKNGRYSSIVTCDATGLGLLQRMALKQTVPIIYLSYHILFRSELKTRNEQILARRESQMIQSVTLALSQDESRKKLIAAELNLPEEKIQCIPVAPEDRFKKKDSLAPSNSSKMILYCGNIEKWNIEEVLNSISESIPAGYHLRIHTHFQPPKSLYKHLLKLDEKQLLRFSFSFLSEEELVNLIDSSHIGLAPYFPKSDSWMVNKTLHHIGKASTKIAYYCMRKKPVITTPLPSLLSALEKYPFGIAIEDWTRIDESIHEINANYGLFSKNAHDYYQSELCPTERLNQFWKKTKNLVPSSSAQTHDRF